MFSWQPISDSEASAELDSDVSGALMLCSKGIVRLSPGFVRRQTARGRNTLNCLDAKGTRGSKGRAQECLQQSRRI